MIERILTTETQRTQRRQIIITAGVLTGNAGISDDGESNLKISEKLKMKNDKLRYCFAMIFEGILTTETLRTERRQIIITAGVLTGNAGISDDGESNLKISEKLKMKSDKLRYCFAMIFEGILTTETLRTERI